MIRRFATIRIRIIRRCFRPPRKFNVFIPTTLIARYDDCLAVLRDHEHFSSRPPAMLQQLRAEFGPFAGATTMLDSDPPVHTRLRRLVGRAFTPRRIKEIEPRIRAIAAELLDRIARAGSFDLMEDFASPLPMIVIAEMLGVPPEEHAQFKAWSNSIIEGGRGTLRGVTPGEKVKATSQELRDYLTGQIERRRREPGEDLITALVQAHDEGGRSRPRSCSRSLYCCCWPAMRPPPISLAMAPSR